MLDLPRKSLLGAMLSLSLVGCNSDSDKKEEDTSADSRLTLSIAHVNDHHSQLEPFAGTSMRLDGKDMQVELGGFSRLTRLFADAEEQFPNLIKLHAGDAITGTLYYTFYQGEADAQMMNTVCFDAFALGNHEFDNGDEGLKGFLESLATDDCNTPILAANVKPAIGTPLAPVAEDDYIKPYTIKVVDGQKVGIVGIDIKGKTQNSSRPLNSTVFLDETQAAQDAIDDLKEQGVEHIVLLTHQGYENDKTMAAKLSGVDVIIGGDSHSLLGDFTSVGYSASGPYPTQVKNLDGDTVCIGQAWEYAKAFGLMQVEFDAAGKVDSCAGQASLVIGDSFEKSDGNGGFVAVNEGEKADLIALLENVPEVTVVAPDANAESTLDNYRSRIDEKKAEVIGFANEAFCLVRVPGESTNRSAGVAGCENANLLAKGSDAAQLVAEAFLDASLRADFALQNAGGVRVPMSAGDITYNTAFTLLPFTNVLVELDITGQEVVDALEDAVSNHLDAAQSTGSQPYAAGLRWDLDLSQPKGTRFSNVEVKNGSGSWVAIEPATTYVMVTNDFIAEGRDGYTTLGEVTDDGRTTNTFLLYTQSLVDYLLKTGMVSPPLRADYSHQQVINASGSTLMD